MKRTSYLWAILFLGVIFARETLASSLSFQNSPSFSIENLQKAMSWFTAEPHPMGSKNQSKIATELKQTLKQFGFDSSEHSFQAIVPNNKSEKFGGEQKTASTTIKVTGKNIIAQHKGNANCSVLIGGHYDTKYFKNFRFVGANDGGSSTILMIELARILKKTNFKKNSFGSCNVILAFFDGEEAFLTDWNEGQMTLGLQDNLYGSREFAKKIKAQKNGDSFYGNKPINLIIILDMIGHKNQTLSITQGSSEKHAEQFVNLSKDIHIHKANFMMEDDHTPFLSLKIPILHIIDWKNLAEWHTENDTPEMISYQAIANLGESLIKFLSLNRN